MKLTGDIRCDFEKVTAENIKLKDRILGYQETISSLRHSLKTVQSSKDRQKADYEELLAQKDAIIKELENRLAHVRICRGACPVRSKSTQPFTWCNSSDTFTVTCKKSIENRFAMGFLHS